MCANNNRILRRALSGAASGSKAPYSLDERRNRQAGNCGQDVADILVER
jgi:hypothetical protein